MDWDSALYFGGIILLFRLLLIAYLYCPILKLIFWILVVLILIGVVWQMRFNIHIKIEKWKWSKKYGIWVSSDGRLKDKNKTLIKQMINVDGYMVYKNKFVHRIVMDTFKPIKTKQNMTVDHLDHNKRNNCLDNLEWVHEKKTKKEPNKISYTAILKTVCIS